ncbi:hypothetical protein HZS_5605 [Henneguya salminicola]|nr:hypothetical protein HZS_5605 [Henneguya salminicola]
MRALTYFYFYYVFLCLCFNGVKLENLASDLSNDMGSESSCSTDHGRSSNCNQGSDKKNIIKLFRWDPVAINYEREIELEIGKTHKMVTKAMNPPIFVIENYMEDYECDHIVSKAKQAGLFSSELHIDPDTLKYKDYAKINLKTYSSNFDLIDTNKDNKINIPEEFQHLAYIINYLYLKPNEVDEILEKFQINVTTEHDQKFITRENFEKINLSGMHEYFNDLRDQHPHHRDRFSDQVWLNVHNTEDKIITKLMERLEKLTGLHHEIVYGTEPIQVVRYFPHGHYHAHFDSQNKSNFPDFPCCHTIIGGTPASCRICRYLTALVYLNNVTKGGHTAFPVADDQLYTHEEFLKRKKGDLYNLSQYCHNGSLVVSPKKGTMILWYNHQLSEDGMLGNLDPYSLHGGCDVIEGEKWIANNWIPAPETPNLIFQNVYKPNYTNAVINESLENRKSNVIAEEAKNMHAEDL